MSHDGAWSRVLEALPRPIGAAVPSRTPLPWDPDDVAHARSTLEPIESRYAWVTDLTTVQRGATVTLHPIVPASPVTEVSLERRVEVAWYDGPDTLEVQTQDAAGTSEVWTVTAPRRP